MDDKVLKQESMFKQFLTSEVKFVIAIITIALGVVAPYYQIRQDIALIQANVTNINSNHEVHIQDIMQDIKDMKTSDKAQDDQIIELQKQILILLNKK